MQRGPGGGRAPYPFWPNGEHGRCFCCCAPWRLLDGAIPSCSGRVYGLCRARGRGGVGGGGASSPLCCPSVIRWQPDQTGLTHRPPGSRSHSWETEGSVVSGPSASLTAAFSASRGDRQEAGGGGVHTQTHTLTIADVSLFILEELVRPLESDCPGISERLRGSNASRCSVHTVTNSTDTLLHSLPSRCLISLEHKL